MEQKMLSRMRKLSMTIDEIESEYRKFRIARIIYYTGAIIWAVSSISFWLI